MEEYSNGPRGGEPPSAKKGIRQKGKKRSAVLAPQTPDDDYETNYLSTQTTKVSKFDSPLKLKFVVQSTKNIDKSSPPKKLDTDANKSGTDFTTASSEMLSPSKLKIKLPVPKSSQGSQFQSSGDILANFLYRNSPSKHVENLPKSVDNSPKSVENPVKSVETQAKIVENPAQSVENPPKVTEMSENAESNVENSSKKKSSRVPEFIVDRSSRIRSYFRRRHAPFRRTFDLDLQCGSMSLLVQVCEDIEECLYFGDEKLVEKFLSAEGIKLAHVNELITQAKNNRQTEDFDETDARGGPSNRSTLNVMAGEDSNDDDYMPTVKEKEKVEKEKRREMQQKLQDGEFISNITERSKVFKSRKDSLIGKIRETDSVCGTLSFLLILNLDQEAAFYHGDPSLASEFFTTGLTSKRFGRSFNIRLFEIDEVDQNKCSVPHCIVSRNLLSRWRLAAIDLFKFPDNLPMTLYICPEAERDQWISDLHLDPNTNGKIAVCSLHFKEGLPTPEFPIPTELLNPKDSELNLEFRGTKQAVEVPPSEPDKPDIMTETEKVVEEDPKMDEGTQNEEKKEVIEEKKAEEFKIPFKKLSVKKDKNEKIDNEEVRRPLSFAKSKHRKALESLRKRRKWIPSNILNDKKLFEIRRKLFATSALFGSKIACKFCSKKFVGNRNYFEHVRTEHVKLVYKCSEDVGASSTEKATPILAVQPKKFKARPIKIEQKELSRYLELFYPKQQLKTMNPKKKYVCATCKSNFDLFGLYSHMKKVHGGLLCQYCLKLFKKVSEIEVHLRSAHQISKWYFHSPKTFCSYAGSAYSFVCSICNDVLIGKEIEQHKCNKVGPRVFDCPNCDKTFPYQKPLEIHISNGWCSLAFAKPGFQRITVEEECAKRFKFITGKEPNFFMLPAPRKKAAAPLAKETSAATSSAATSSVVAVSVKKPLKFNICDRQILYKYNGISQKSENEKNQDLKPIQDLPETGSIFCGKRARGVNSDIRRELRESARSFKIRDESEILRAGTNFFLDSKPGSASQLLDDVENNSDSDSGKKSAVILGNEDRENLDPKSEYVCEETKSEVVEDTAVAVVASSPLRLKMPEKMLLAGKKQKVSVKISLPIKKESKCDRMARQLNEIEKCLDKLRLLVDHFGNESGCLFCQQARVVTVDAIFLLSHLTVVHDRDVVEQKLDENVETAILRIRTNLKDTRKDEFIFRYNRDLTNITYSCCYCDLTITNNYDELFAHLNVAHNSKVLNCHLCQNIFLNYGSFVSHVCFGPVQQQAQQVGKCRAKFVCPICEKNDLSTFLDFQFHVRNHHNVCEICLMPCPRQEELSDHCLTHSQEMMCMKCFLTFDDLNQFRKHLYYKHESEHTVCKNCHQKTWPHVYHFCIQPKNSICEVCDKNFDNLKQYRVHLRTHTGANPHLCTARGCNKSYISKQLLLKHQVRRHPELRVTANKSLEDRRNQKLCLRFGAKNIDTIHLSEALIDDLITRAVRTSETPIEEEKPNPERVESPIDKTELDPGPTETSTYLDPVDAAVRSIMGPDCSFDLHMSPTKSLSHIIMPSISPIRQAISPVRQMSMLSPLKVPTPPPSTNSSNGSIQSALPGSPALPGSFSPPQLAVRVAQSLVSSKPATTPVPLNIKSALTTTATPTLPLVNNNNKEVDNSATDDAPSDMEASKSPVISEKKKMTNGHDHDMSSNDNSTVEKPIDDDPVNPVIGGIWNQDLFFVSKPSPTSGDIVPPPTKRGCKVMKPRYQVSGAAQQGLRALAPNSESPERVESPRPEARTLLTSFDATSISKKLETGGWDVMLSESSDSENEGATPKVRIIERVVFDKRLSLRDHDYCFDSYQASQRPPTPPPAPAKIVAAAKPLPPVKAPAEDLSEMDKIANNVAMGVAFDSGSAAKGDKKIKRKKESKKKKKKKKKHKKNKDNRDSSSSDSDSDLDVTTMGGAGRPLAESTPAPSAARKGPKPKYHTSMTGRGVTAGTARPRFSSSSDDVSSNDNLSNAELASSDLDTDFSADEKSQTTVVAKRAAKPTHKIAALKATERRLSHVEEPAVSTPTIKLKIKLPPTSSLLTSEMSSPKSRPSTDSKRGKYKTKQNLNKILPKSKKPEHYGFSEYNAAPNRKKSTDSWSKRKPDTSTSDSDEQNMVIDTSRTDIPPLDNSISDKLYCVCQCPHDDVSEMIGCDAPDCRLEWFHFECVGIMVPPKGQWYCPECQDRYRIKDRNFL